MAVAQVWAVHLFSTLEELMSFMAGQIINSNSNCIRNLGVHKYDQMTTAGFNFNLLLIFNSEDHIFRVSNCRYVKYFSRSQEKTLSHIEVLLIQIFHTPDDQRRATKNVSIFSNFIPFGYV